VSFRLHVRNVSDGQILLIHYGTWGWLPQVRDGSGKLVPVANPPDHRPVRTHHVSLQPRESRLIGDIRLQIFRGQKKERPSRGDVVLKPGSYRLSQTFRFPRDSEGKVTWAGELTSAEVPLTVEIDAEPRQNAEAFLGAALAGDDQAAAKLAEPRSAVARQLPDLRQLAGPKKLRIISVHADEADGLAVTSEVSDDRGRKGQLLLRLRKRRGNWKVTDIDFEARVQAREQVKAFLDAHPGAVAIPPAALPADKPATQPAGRR